MADQEEDFSQLPLPDRFTHKNWKVRKEGYEAAVKTFEVTPDESDPAFRPFLQDPGLWKGAAGDSNVAAQQEGLGALCAFLKYGGQQAASRTRSLAVTPITEKGLIQTRPAAKANALEALMLYVELDKPDALVEELFPALSHKQPKVIAATLNALTALFHAYGVKIIDPKPVLKALAKPFGHADKNVRAEASNLTVELYRWLKEALKAIFWNDLKPVQQQDLEKLFEKVKEEAPPKQERFTRAQQAAMAAAEESGKGGASAVEEVGEEDDGGAAEEVDVFDLAEPVDILSKIPKDFHDNIASTKWKERKEALDALSDVLNTPRIKDGPYDDIVRAFAKSMKDANITVVIAAANCTEKLALGLRRSFAKYRSTIMSPMMERLKEKKQSVADALSAALDAIFGSTSLSECLEDILGFLTNKNPQVKLESTKFLIRCLKNTRDVPTNPEVKLIADATTKVLTDTSEVTRSAGAEALGTLMKIMGERAMGPYLDGLDEIRKTKIKEYFETAEVKAKNRPKPIVGPPKGAAAGGPGKKAAPGAKKPSAGPKKPVAAAPPRPPVEEPTPLQPKPTAKSLPKPGGLSKPGVGLKAAPPGLKRPGSIAAPRSMQSPRRVISPPTAVEEEAPTTPTAPTSRFGMGRGGLTGRPLGKPAPISSHTDSASTPAASSGMSAIERAELEELRLEKERLTKLTDDLRSSSTKLTAEISELQNQNAQLIEDHTRDVLQIKAKETQLVRARGENDVLRTEIETVRKENERLKREVGRLGRESLGRERESLLATQEGSSIYEDANGGSGTGLNGIHGARPTSTILARNNSGASSAGSSRPRSFMVSPSEEKENTDGISATGRRKISPPLSGVTAYSSGRSSPQRAGVMAGSGARSGSGGGGEGQSAEPAENWKRAAEVTSQLKARIEQMKARQGLNRGH
ncbi:putative spindle pole body [Phaeomoniella chlamydospora]|uniref:Putative spindle pole body n=1 Tax=Phaeomoniella chlamydospora TaxID=158046 RepID=A0A0G2ELE8_PHACM|nr:putative spindle pole body [Phaeomoniella chlamydospora]